MNPFKPWSIPLAICVAIGMQACSSSGDSASSDIPDGSINATSAESLNSTFNAIEGLLDNIETDDSSPSAKIRQINGGSDYKPSLHACEAMHQARRVFGQALERAQPICAIDKVSKTLGVELGSDYTYFSVTGVEENDPGKKLLLRAKLLSNDSGETEGLTFQVCNNRSGSLTQEENFVAKVSKNDAGEYGVTLKAQGVRNEEFEGHTESGKESLVMEAYGTEEEISSVNVDAAWNFVHDSFGSDKGSATASADKTAKTLKTYGKFENEYSYVDPNNPESTPQEFSNNLGDCLISKGGFGAVKAEGNWTYPSYQKYVPGEGETPGTFVAACFERPGNVAEEPSDGICTETFSFEEAFIRIKTSIPLTEEEEQEIEFFGLYDGDYKSVLIDKLADCSIPERVEPTDLEDTWDCNTGDATVHEVNLVEVEGIEDCFKERKYKDDNQSSCMKDFNEHEQSSGSDQEQNPPQG